VKQEAKIRLRLGGFLNGFTQRKPNGQTERPDALWAVAWGNWSPHHTDAPIASAAPQSKTFITQTHTTTTPQLDPHGSCPFVKIKTKDLRTFKDQPKNT